jgi:hypothetical protein
MKTPQLQSFDEIIKHLDTDKRQRHLLLGNGFSMAYDSKIFSYNALSKFIENLEDEILQKIFNIIKTNNFELIMQQLDNFSQIAKVFNIDTSIIAKIDKASQTLKESLINAVKELHPEHVFSIPVEKSQACAAFLNTFIKAGGNVFTTNYDLLLYWVLMRNNIENKTDGFGRYKEDTGDYVPSEDANYSELIWGKNKENQNIHYLHGALPIFDNGVDIIKEEYANHEYLLTNIKKRLNKKEYPIFVTAGNGHEKLSHIMHNQYLSYCFEHFSNIEGSLITFGFNFGDYDTHIIDAINKASKKKKDENGKWHMLNSIYIGVYSESDYKHIQALEDSKKFKCKVNIFDAKTAKVWG